MLAGESATEKSKKIDRAVARCGGAALEGIAAGDKGVDGERSRCHRARRATAVKMASSAGPVGPASAVAGKRRWRRVEQRGRVRRPTDRAKLARSRPWARRTGSSPSPIRLKKIKKINTNQLKLRFNNKINPKNAHEYQKIPGKFQKSPNPMNY